MCAKARRERRRERRKVGRTGARFPSANLAEEDTGVQPAAEPVSDEGLDIFNEPGPAPEPEPEPGPAPEPEPVVAAEAEADAEPADEPEPGGEQEGEGPVEATAAEDVAVGPAEAESVSKPETEPEQPSEPEPEPGPEQAPEAVTDIAAALDPESTPDLEPAAPEPTPEATADPEPALASETAAEAEQTAEREPEAPLEREPAPAPANALLEPEERTESASDDFGADDVKSWVRPYVWTGGRTDTTRKFALETLVSASKAERTGDEMMRDEHRRVLDLCDQPRSVSEIAALLSVPLGVAKTLLGVMAEEELLVVHGNNYSGDSGPDLALMERVLRGLKNL